MKILIIDDSTLDRKLVVNAIQKGGITNEILQAKNGQEGLTLLSEHYEDLCLMMVDWQMPQVDGLEFMRAAREVPATAGIPIVMLTASSSEDNKKQAHEANPDLKGYIVKPFKPDELVAVVKKYAK